MRLPILVAVLTLVFACTQNDAYQRGEETAGEGQTEPATREPAPVAAKPTPPAKAATANVGVPQPASAVVPARTKPATRAPAALSISGVSAVFVTASLAENALGKQVAPPAGGAVAVDLRFELLPGRALDPVLEIGGAKFRRYQTLPGGVLRYVVAGRDLAEAGEVVLRWGADVIVVADQLVVSQ